MLIPLKESAAQATGKPLFTVSVSDIELKPDQVEGEFGTGLQPGIEMGSRPTIVSFAAHPTRRSADIT
jgi:hypothetical protein